MKRFYTSLIYLTISLLASTQSFSQGINFLQDDWQNVLIQAKAQKKLIFVDVYTTWCGPCKEMDKRTFTEVSVGEKFNTTFINYKIDAEKGFGVTLAKRYNITSYPTCLFVDPTENLIYKQEGLLRAPDLLKEAEMVIENQANSKPLYTLDKLYEDGRRDTEFLNEYIAIRSLYDRIDNRELVEEYVKSLPTIQYSSDKTLRIIVNNGFKIDGIAFGILLKFREKAETLFEGGFEKVNRAFSQSINEVFDVALKTKNLVLFEEALAANLKTLPITSDRVNGKNKLAFYLGMKDVNKFTDAAEQYIDQYVMFVQVESIRKQDSWEYEKIMQNYKLGIRDSVGAGAIMYYNLKLNAKNTMARLTATELNEVVKAFNEQVDDKAKLNKATEWAKRSLELVETPDAYHTYAQLMLKLGDKQMAMDIEQKAYDSAIREKIDTQKFTAALEKMR